MDLDDVQALISVDVQRGHFTGMHSIADAPEVLSAIGHALDAARRAGSLVLHVQHSGERGMADEEGTAGWPLVFEPLADEPVLPNRTDDAFDNPALLTLLQQSRVTAVAVVGVQSEMCVSATVRTAMCRGLRVVVPHGAHGTHDVPELEGICEAVPGLESSPGSPNGHWAMESRSPRVSMPSTSHRSSRADRRTARDAR